MITAYGFASKVFNNAQTDVLKLEPSVPELHQMLADLPLLVEQQGVIDI